MSLEKDGELIAQLNVQAASPSSRTCVCVHLYVCVHWHNCLAIIVLGVKTHLWIKWAKTNHEVRVCT